MIAGIFHEGSGLGNQLQRYVATRVLAEDKGYQWGMLNHENFKGGSFMNINKGGKDIDYPNAIGLMRPSWHEKRIDNEQGVDIRPYDPRIVNVEDNTVIDGEFQDERYFIHRLNEVREWLKVEPLDVHANECVISFRGGEYALYPDLFLGFSYWHLAMENMRKENPDIEFRIVTDDPETASRMLPGIPVTHEIGHDWRSIRYAPYLILSNSSFGILPALLNQNARKIIAPLHWARHNLGFWALPQNCYSAFTYQNHEGKLTSGIEEKAKLS